MENQADQIDKLKKIGDTLKKKRKENSYTLEEIAETTRIHISSLRNIEEGNLADLPGLVFVRGFIRNYAKILEIECDWMINDLNYIYKTNQNSYDVQSDEGEGINDSQEAQSTGKKKSILPLVFLGVLVAAVIFLFISPLSTFDSDEKEAISSVKNQEEVSSVSEEGETAAVAATQEAEPEAQTPVQPEVVNKPISPLNLKIRARENGWMRLTIDEQNAFDIYIEEGKDYEWPGQEEYILELGKGSLATIYLNNEEIEIEKAKKDQYLKMKLDKFILTRINN